MTVRISLHRAFGKAVFGLAAFPALVACNPATAPEPGASQPSAEEQAEQAKARAKAEREAKLASFYGGGAPADAATKKPEREEADTGSPPSNIETANAAPPPPAAISAPAPPDPGGPPIQ